MRWVLAILTYGLIVGCAPRGEAFRAVEDSRPIAPAGSVRFHEWFATCPAIFEDVMGGGFVFAIWADGRIVRAREPGEWSGEFVYGRLSPQDLSRVLKTAERLVRTHASEGIPFDFPSAELVVLTNAEPERLVVIQNARTLAGHPPSHPLLDLEQEVFALPIASPEPLTIDLSGTSDPNLLFPARYCLER